MHASFAATNVEAVTTRGHQRAWHHRKAPTDVQRCMMTVAACVLQAQTPTLSMAPVT
jgi:hypothetical protein